MSTEFKVGAFQYRAEKLDAMTQFHVVRRLAPVLTSFNDIVAAAQAGAQKTVGAKRRKKGDANG